MSLAFLPRPRPALWKHRWDDPKPDRVEVIGMHDRNWICIDFEGVPRLAEFDFVTFTPQEDPHAEHYRIIDEKRAELRELIRTQQERGS